MDPIIQDNIDLLLQGIDLLGKLDTKVYTSPVPACFHSRIGGHVRHNLDHYQSFLRGWADARVDYDDRLRETLIEADPAHAIEQAFGVVSGLKEVAGGSLDGPLQVKMDCGRCTGDEAWSHSTARRELQFLLSHTVHHYALLSVMCRFLGVEPAPGFGIAPSTQKYQLEQARNQRCAQ